MRVGVCVQPKIDDPDYAVRLESRGYDSAWFADSPTIWSDCYAALALAAERTSRIRLGTGVAVAGLRTPTTTAGSIATINRVAPGRTFLAMGNGNTGWRLLGHKPVPVAAFRRELVSIRSMLQGEQIRLELRGKTTTAGFQMLDLGFVDVEHPVPLVVSAFGPRTMQLAAEVGDGLVTTLVGRSHIARFGTGDLATLEPGGGFVYLARMGDALRLAGFLTDPAEIEQHLLSYPAVTGAQVVGASTPAGRTVAVAFVTGEADLDEALLVAHCRDGMANYKVPARIEVVDSFPTVDAANGVKVRKAALRDRAAALVARG